MTERPVPAGTGRHSFFKSCLRFVQNAFMPYTQLVGILRSVNRRKAGGPRYFIHCALGHARATARPRPDNPQGFVPSHRAGSPARGAARSKIPRRFLEAAGILSFLNSGTGAAGSAGSPASPPRPWPRLPPAKPRCRSPARTAGRSPRRAPGTPGCAERRWPPTPARC